MFSTDLPTLVILIDISILEINEASSKAAALKLITELSESNNITIHEYTLILIDQGYWLINCNSQSSFIWN